MRVIAIHHSLVLVLFASGLATPGLSAQEMTGFTPGSAAKQAALEVALDSLVRPARIRADSRVLSAEPHVAGTAAQTRTADHVLRELASAGWDTSRVTFQVYLPHQDSGVVELVRPERRGLRLTEPPLRQDPTTTGRIWPAMNAYSGSGDVTAAVVNAGFGLPADYTTLDSMGVDVRGRVVIARYGRGHRGIKAREAERHGAVALLLYSDPQDDGYFLGPTYPNGPMRHPDASQRGSVSVIPGDLTTPGRPSTIDAIRLPADSIPAPHIPVLPIGYRNAQLILQPLGGPEVPQGWQGGLPFRYRIGGTEDVAVRVAAWPERGDRAFKTIVNTVARWDGSRWPDEWVLAGGHRDAWGPGAVDNVSGVASLLEVARALGAAWAGDGGPARTIVIATFDAEEWGLVGSVEQVESMEDELRRKAVAYMNLDAIATGRSFGTSSTASLRGLVRDAARAVRQPGESLSVFAAALRVARAPDTTDLPFGNLGGGSDFAGFYNHLGIPAFEVGFSGRYGAYHSAYDTFAWMERFGDPGFVSHAAVARMAALMLTRLANAEVLPYDYDELGRHITGLVADRRKEARESAMPDADWVGLEQALTRFAAAARSLVSARSAATAGAARPGADLARANAALRAVEPALTRAEGLAGRPWMRNLVYAPARDDGYGEAALPGVAEAIDDRDGARLEVELRDLTSRVRSATALLEEAVEALGG
jgi:N-acetylated-alpha-linked acidic dipeptidase